MPGLFLSSRPVFFVLFGRSGCSGPEKPPLLLPAVAQVRAPSAMKCFVCGGVEVKYRFPCCRERYCSLPCYRRHAAGQCPARPERESAKRPRKEEPEEEDLISEVRLCALRGHVGVRSALQNEAFQDALITLDEAHDRRQTLEKLLEKDKFFLKFVGDLMEAIDYFPRDRDLKPM